MASTFRANPLDELAIRNTLSRYCTALDTKDFDLLSRVFTPNIKADYPFNPSMQGVEAIQSAIQNRLGPIRTHHSLTTQHIIFEDEGKALATTHFIGAHLGQGPHEGKVLTAYGKYIDTVVLVDDDSGVDGVPGASGKWRIETRTVEFTGRVGDEKIMQEF